MSSVSAGSLIYRVRWSVNCSPTISLLIMRRESRLTSRENIGLECSSLRLGHGNTATLPIPMSGAMGTMPHPSSLPAALLTRSLFFSREIKFGALRDNLPQGTQFLATGKFTTSSIRILRSTCDFQVIMRARLTTHPITVQSSCARAT